MIKSGSYDKKGTLYIGIQTDEGINYDRRTRSIKFKYTYGSTNSTGERDTISNPESGTIETSFQHDINIPAKIISTTGIEYSVLGSNHDERKRITTLDVIRLV